MEWLIERSDPRAAHKEEIAEEIEKKQGVGLPKGKLSEWRFRLVQAAGRGEMLQKDRCPYGRQKARAAREGGVPERRPPLPA